MFNIILEIPLGRNARSEGGQFTVRACATENDGRSDSHRMSGQQTRGKVGCVYKELGEGGGLGCSNKVCQRGTNLRRLVLPSYIIRKDKLAHPCPSGPYISVIGDPSHPLLPFDFSRSRFVSKGISME